MLVYHAYAYGRYIYLSFIYSHSSCRGLDRIPLFQSLILWQWFLWNSFFLRSLPCSSWLCPLLGSERSYFLVPPPCQMSDSHLSCCHIYNQMSSLSLSRKPYHTYVLTHVRWFADVYSSVSVLSVYCKKVILSLKGTVTSFTARCSEKALYFE